MAHARNGSPQPFKLEQRLLLLGWLNSLLGTSRTRIYCEI